MLEFGKYYCAEPDDGAVGGGEDACACKVGD